jgi:hypothetical protein
MVAEGAARLLAGFSLTEVDEKLGLSAQVVSVAERYCSGVAVLALRLQALYQAAGAEFLSEGDVRLVTPVSQ